MVDGEDIERGRVEGKVGWGLEGCEEAVGKGRIGAAVGLAVSGWVGKTLSGSDGSDGSDVRPSEAGTGVVACPRPT